MKKFDHSVSTSYTKSMSTYKKAAERREQILKIACETAAGNVSRVVGSMEEMRTLLIEYALQNDREVIIAQAIIDKHPAVDHLCADRRGQILAAMA